MKSKDFTLHPSLFSFTESAAFGRVLPKNKIYEHGSPSAAVRQLFVRQVEQIVWQYKLAPETVNLKASKTVPEIQIISLTLKGDVLKPEVLRCIDLAIPFPIIFELRFDGKVKPVAAFKRPSEADASKWVINEYFDSDWTATDKPRKPLADGFRPRGSLRPFAAALDAVPGTVGRRPAKASGTDGAHSPQATRAGSLRGPASQRETI